MPDPRPIERRIDDTAGDMPSLVELGLAEPQAQPSYEGIFVEPDIPPEGPAE